MASKAPPKTLLQRTGPGILVSFTAVGLVYAYVASSNNSLRTPGVRNIERAYSAGGGTATHTPSNGHGADNLTRAQRAKGAVDGTPDLQRNGNGPQRSEVGSEQRPLQPTAAGKAWNQLHYKSDSGK